MLEIDHSRLGENERLISAEKLVRTFHSDRDLVL
jgi:hypothetical protein